MKPFLLCALVLLAWAGVATAQDICAPGKLSVNVIPGRTTAVVEWTNTGDDCTTGNAASYEVRRSTSPITDTDWQSATVVATGAAGNQGTQTCVEFSAGLTCQTTYYWVVFLIDDAGNRSPMSNVEQETETNCSNGADAYCS